MPTRINIPPSPRQDDTEAMSTWYARIRDAILKTGQAITWLNLDFTGSNLTSILTRNHNDLQNVQGGSNGSRYHLTSAEHTDLTDGGGTTLHTHSYNNLTDLPPGLTVVITTAKLTTTGANGSMTFTDGRLTTQTQAT
jgi:hypothetical protein